MTQEKVEAIAQQALVWAQGSWGQGVYDAPRYDKDTMVAIYTALAQKAKAVADLHASTTSY